jgi:TRAP-type C4-dicarboxylate transport system permease small subunit
MVFRDVLLHLWRLLELYEPGKPQAMIAGRMALGAISQGVLLGMAALMAVPSLMLFLSLVLPPRLNRWMNIILGAVYTVIMILAIWGAWHFYIFFGLIGITLTLLIILVRMELAEATDPLMDGRRHIRVGQSP